MDTFGFWAQAEASPDRIAVISAETGATVTYGELAARANRLGRGLRNRGLKVGETVAALLPNVPELLAVQLAAFQVGLHFVPVNRHLTAGECAYILGDCEARLLVTEAGIADVAREAADEAGIAPDARFCVGAVPGFTALEELEEGSAERPDERTAGAVMVYSSGTTGHPKGIRRPLAGVDPDLAVGAARANVTLLGMDKGGVTLTLGPLYHAAPNSMSVSALHAGHRLVLGQGFDPHRALDLVQRYRITHSFMVPTMFQRLLKLSERERAGYDVSSLELIIHSAAPCPQAVKRAMIDWMGPVIMEFYGASENSLVTRAFSDEWLARPGTVGRARAGVELRIQDDSGRVMPAGAPGLIATRGGSAFSYNRSADGALVPHGDWFVSGDIGYLDEDGWLFLCDRRTDLIISGGVNIYPAEIEGALLEHPAVADAVVIGTPDEEWGQRVTALVEPVAGREPGPELAEELIAHCRERLAKYKCPRAVEFREHLPRTASGKLSRLRMREEYLAGTTGAGV
ncbi:AMP-binding protein [Streptomyces abyssomicinicus]|uniref:AMP-binding protein n=1 Tax=Streptomyces abyssomicinicus TaxID=574929 RepID=UPI0012501D0A|nr:AMP-binding protein [Streptomyces abyssomicinicus]